MARPSSAFGQDNLNHSFLRALLDCTKGIVNSLSANANNLGTATAIQITITQLIHDYSCLISIVDIIQDRVYHEAQWASAAVAAYDLLAMSIVPYFQYPSLPLRGPFLIQRQITKALQAQFTAIVAVQVWSDGFTHFSCTAVPKQCQHQKIDARHHAPCHVWYG